MSSNKHKKTKLSNQRTTRKTSYYCFQHVSSIYYAFVLIALLNCYVRHIDGFNLENRLPIVKLGDANSYFGYSVASHVIETDGPDNEKW